MKNILFKDLQLYCRYIFEDEYEHVRRYDYAKRYKPNPNKAG